ncbi:MAG: choice-of-anchor D domain-containing protein [Bacteroidota bacterium]
MKKLILLLVGIFPYLAEGNVVISYLQPDIVAPGMNSYIEFIAPYNAYGNFGADRTFYNLPTDTLKIEVVNPSDRWKLTFGPLVVSWQGRMISTQVFAHPSLKPNSWDWSLLQQDFRIKVRINKNGVLSNEVDLYIVQPFPFGNKSSSIDSVLGAGSLGKRSPRGAMIVDSMILANRTYYVSTSDPDPATPGNQGYLPFILISKGPIRGGANTLISVDGGLTGGQQRLLDAGPGGGGGGGRFYDAGLFSDNSQNGDDGGNGFTGGGSGGRNNSSLPGVTNSMKLPGIGTLEITSNTPARGYSLNGVPPSYIPNVYESAGGGTGHPFGRSGKHCNDGNNCIPPGGYGGGSGVKQNTPGGSGGNATDGQGNNNSGGKAVGNRMITPLAGGSGGASGNPQSGGNYSGSGGGGGGAIMIYAPEISNVRISAKGANGQNGVNSSNGGGGSGGSVITSAKLSVDNGSSQSIFIEGGKAGGATNQFGGWGRVRRDAPNWNVNIGSAAAEPMTYYQGPSTDTTRYIKPLVPFLVRGSKKFEDSLQIWLKPETREWTYVATIPQNQGFWEVPMLLDRTDSVYYLVALQNVPNPEKSNEYRCEPDFLMTQAAANVLLLEKIPEFYCQDTLFCDTLLACDGQEVKFKARIYNLGDADLILSDAYSTKGFLLSNINNTIVAPFDSIDIEISYNYKKNHPTIINDTLFINHNDYWTGAANPFPIAVNINILSLNLSTNLHSFIQPYSNGINLSSVKTYTINACLGQSYKILASVGNLSDTIMNLENILTSSSDISTQIVGNRSIPRLDTCTYTIDLTANSLGTRSYKLYYKLQECDNIIDSLEIILITTRAELTFLDNGDFPDTRIGSSNLKGIRVRNTGNSRIYINSASVSGNDFSMVDVMPGLPRVLNPNDEITITVRFSPLNQGNLLGQLNIITLPTDSTCVYDIGLPLRGKGLETSVLASKYLLDFDTLYTCQIAYDTVYLINPTGSNFRYNVTQPAKIVGSNAFAIAEQPNTPVAVQPGDSVRYIIKFEQGFAGSFAAELIINTDEPGYEEVKIQLKGTKDTLNIEIVPNPIDLGDVPVGTTVNSTFSIRNKGLLPINLKNIKFENQQVAGNFIPTNGVILPNEEQNFDFSIRIDKGINKSEPFLLEFEECNWTATELITFNKIFSHPITNSPVDWGIVSGCEDTVKSIYVRNTSSNPIILKSWQINGIDKDLFHFRGQNFTLPRSFVLNETFEMIVSFEPLNSTNGNKQAYIMFEAESNGEDTTIVVQLMGEKRSTAVAVPDNISFGGKVINTISQMSFSLTNTGIFPITITSIEMPKYYPTVFSVEPDISGYTLNPQEQQIFTVSFLPLAQMQYFDTIVINTRYKNCDEKIYIYLEGSGLPPRILTLKIPQLELIDPRWTDYSIPIYAKIENDTLQNFSIDSLFVEFNRSLFYPKNVTNGRIISNRIVNQNRIIGVGINNISIAQLNTEIKIAEIVGDVLLGNDTATTLRFLSVSNPDTIRVQRYNFENGSLSIKVCPEGGNRLLDVHNRPISIIVSPNPFSDNTTITLSLLESGFHKLELYNLNGVMVDEIGSFEIGQSGIKERTINVNSSRLANGVYLLKLTTPTTYYTKLIIVNK